MVQGRARGMTVRSVSGGLLVPGVVLEGGTLTSSAAGSQAGSQYCIARGFAGGLARVGGVWKGVGAGWWW